MTRGFSQGVAAIAIGRNEGVRLHGCLASLRGQASPVIYVDSGSSDGSVAAASTAGAEVVKLDMTKPFTAARARNAGLVRLMELEPHGELVQFLDGDCELRGDWLEVAIKAILADPSIAVVCGRRRERYPEASIWNQLIDEEWDTPIGEVQSCGGDALMRRCALEAVGGYRDDLIAGEEPEMCFRMRSRGWRILRIDAEMTWHDAAITNPVQWWNRSRRAGHAFAEVSSLHGSNSERFWVAETRRAVFWGACLPGATLLVCLAAGPIGLFLLLAYPFQVLRLRFRGYSWARSISITISKLSEAQGTLGYWSRRLMGRRSELIEYK